ncbi:alkaline phosphatase family protein [Candidatus Roizmanbacteria bacterium]|nr:alkaline phosphatase family protein [Candidatus Roizmanbacteria bacterium]
MRKVLLSLLLRVFHLHKSSVPIEKKGLIVILVDGLSYDIFKRSLEKKQGSFFSKLIKKGYSVYPYFCGVPASTAATEAELFFGASENIPGFTWYDRSLSQFVRGNRGKSIVGFEHDMKKKANLLKSGSCILGIYSAGATQCDLSGTELNLKSPMKAFRKLHYLLFIFLNPVRLLLTCYLIVISMSMSVYISSKERSKKKLITLLKSAFSRIFLGNIASYIAELEIARETPVLFIDYVLYDEFAHEYGVDDKISYSSIRLIDWYCESLYKTAKKSKRKYDFIILSDHGQTQSRPLDKSSRLENIVQNALNDPSYHVLRTFGFSSPPQKSKNVFLVPAGSSVQVYFSETLKKPYLLGGLEETFPHIIDRLLKNPEIGWVLVRQGNDKQLLMGKKGSVEFTNGRVLKTTGSPFVGLPVDKRALMSLARYASFENNGDLVLFGNIDDDGKLYAFEEHKGTHGGFYGDMTKPFILTDNKSVIHQIKRDDDMRVVFESIRSSYGADKL